MTATTTPKSAPTTSIRTRLATLSISFKLAALIATGFLVTFSVSFLLITANVRAMGLEFQSEKETVIARILAAQMQVPLHLGDERRLAKIYEPVVENDRSLMRIDIVNAAGELLVRHDSGGDVPDALRGLTQETLNQGKLLRRGTSSINLVTVPVISDDGETLLGAAGFVWSNGGFLSTQITEIGKSVAISALVAIIGLAGIVFVISRVVTRPIKTLSAAMETVSDHDYEADIPGTERRDEIGIMASKLALFRDTLAKEEQLDVVRQEESALRRKLFVRLGEGMSQLASGRTDCPIDVDEFARLDKNHVEICENFNDVLLNLRDMLSTIVSTAESVRTSSREISEVAEDQSKRSEAQAGMLEESAAAIEELNTSVQKTASLASDANEHIADNKKRAAAGGEVVDKTVKAMRDIEESSQQITAIIGVIDDIAFQTNLLALNAGVEAARAGESGRGFAVVASEVRALAQRASTSANEIKELILRSSAHVTDGSELANQAGAALSDIIGGVNHVSDLVSEIATGSREQATNLAEIKESVTSLDKVTQQNAVVIEESSSASRSLSNEAERMSEALRRFSIEGTLNEELEEDALPEESAAIQADEIALAKDMESQIAEPTLVFRSQAGSRKKIANGQEDWHDF